MHTFLWEMLMIFSGARRQSSIEIFEKLPRARVLLVVKPANPRGGTQPLNIVNVFTTTSFWCQSPAAGWFTPFSRHSCRVVSTDVWCRCQCPEQPPVRRPETAVCHKPADGTITYTHARARQRLWHDLNVQLVLHKPVHAAATGTEACAEAAAAELY